MKILVYYCYGGAHTSVTCASIHLNYLPSDRIPGPEEFAPLPFYDKMDHDKLGTPVYMGRDEYGWDVYIIGLKRANAVIIPAIRTYLNACGKDQADLLLVNALVELHPLTSIGGYSSRRLGLLSLGRRMTVWGIRKSYPKFLDLVSRVKENLRMRHY
ncbi:MAG TPA: DUF3189 family protein [Candidatus Atribacteria bacterium]|nr:DUF3189 family protein [Candidatus Atribacteria bacterium]